MENFIFQNPVKLIMGRGMIARLAKEIPSDKRIMITFGGGSVKKNGVYDQVKEALKNHYTVEFWGIEPNPAIETLRKAIALGKEEKVDYLLAVGGGSVIDGTKLISAGLLYDGDAWDLVLAGCPATHTVPLSTVLTLPATGSEMNNGAVISRRETKEKYPFYSNYPLFSILDPEVTFTLPPHQVACGLADTFVHVMEQYMTTPRQSRVMDRWAEGLLQTLIEIAPKIRENQHDYQLMADFMLSATMALNGFIAMGVSQDWATVEDMSDTEFLMIGINPAMLGQVLDITSYDGMDYAFYNMTELGADDLTAVDPYGWSEICSAGKFKVEKTDNRVKITFSFTLLSGGKFEGSYEGAYSEIKQSTTNILTLNGENTRDIKATFYEKTDEGVALYLTPSRISSAADLENVNTYYVRLFVPNAGLNGQEVDITNTNLAFEFTYYSPYDEERIQISKGHLEDAAGTFSVSKSADNEYSLSADFDTLNVPAASSR